MTPAVLDEVDREILGLLRQDGRVSVSEMARELGLSRAAVGQRLQRLLRERIVTVNAMAHPMTHGYGESALIGVKVDHRLSEVSEALAEVPEIYYVVTTTGRYDITAELMAKDMRHLLELSMMIRGLPGVVSTEVLSFVDMVKWSYRPRNME